MQERFGCRGIRQVAPRHSHAARHWKRRCSSLAGPGSNGLADLIAKNLRLLSADPGQNHEELLAAVAAHGCRPGREAGNSVSALAQNRVAGPVPETVVD